MSVVSNAILAIGFLLLITWVLFFGALGGLLSYLRGSSVADGVLRSAPLGPVGLVWVLLRTRGMAAGIEELGSGTDDWAGL